MSMRLTCPNCSARYEVDDSLIPPEGRDVQCSNCATTWFQPGNRARVEDPTPAPTGDGERSTPRRDAPIKGPVRSDKPLTSITLL